MHDAAWYADHDIDLRVRTAVRGIDTDARTVKLQGGDELTYGSALLATGSLVNRLRVDGSDLDGLHYVRALGNAESIRDDAEHARRVVVVGGSYIGCEVAASLTQMGKKVTVVMQEDEPMEGGFGPAVGRWIRGLLEGHGIEFLGGRQLDRFEGDGRVQLVVTGVGRRAGRRPGGAGHRREAGRDAGQGRRPVARRVRRRRSATRACRPRRPTCTPPATSASTTAPCTAAASGSSTRRWPRPRAPTWPRPCWARRSRHTEVPYFWTDLADWGSLEYVGPAARWGEEIVRGSMDDGEFSVLYLDGDRLVACASSGRGDDLEAATKIIAAGGELPADHEALGDAARPLPA